MTNADYYAEKKWCENCRTYVRYLMSVDHSFCAECGRQVRLFSREDARRFSETMERQKWKAS